ncbi:MAG: hypothetical protein LAO04_22310 [Acidobacteriia bacterium]|nr:hypothetical protein [Terriglobia bacterium]
MQAGDVPGLDEPHRRLVIGRSGINSLEQIVAARMNLTASLYHHHKVRAAECMVKAAVEYVCLEESSRKSSRKPPCDGLNWGPRSRKWRAPAR